MNEIEKGVDYQLYANEKECRPVCRAGYPGKSVLFEFCRGLFDLCKFIDPGFATFAE